MEIEIFALCDAATQYGPRFNILGVFDVLHTKSFPLVYPQCSVALRIRFQQIEAGQHKIKINFVDEDGKEFMRSLDSGINVVFKGKQQSGVANLILNIQRLKIDKEGQYSIDLAIDGKFVRSLPIFVKSINDLPPTPIYE